MRSGELEKGKVYHNGKLEPKYRARKITGFDGINGVNYIELPTGRIGNCSLAQFCSWAKGVV